MRPICLDLTRLVSRTGRGPHTGIDRVERAWLEGLLRRDGALFGLVRIGQEFRWLDRAGVAALAGRIAGTQAWGRSSLRSGLYRRRPEMLRRADADLARLAVARTTEGRIADLLPAGCAYVNVGHTNLTAGHLGAFAASGAPVAVLLHDTIPLDLPHTQRPGTETQFRARFTAATRNASVILCNSHATAERVAFHARARVDCIVAPLGLDHTPADRAALPAEVSGNRPYFVAIGTVDGRKNQSLLLDVWAELARAGAESPALVLAGSAGWGPPELLERLARDPLMGQHVLHLPDLGDGAIAALTEGAQALLHPSLAEGFGFPVLDAARRGVPVLCSDLPVFREYLGDIPVYAESGSMYHWVQSVTDLIKGKNADRAATRTWPIDPDALTWDRHLNLALSKLD